jgi:hypothetical protein
MAINRLGAQQGAAAFTATTQGGLAALAQELRSQRLGRVIVLQGKPQERAQVAQALARELGFRLDLAAVVSKYIGETEKNLSRVLGQSNRSSAILFFDEADALFGKRTEVKDSHDRYANDPSHLFASFQGVLLLGVNRKEDLPHGVVLKSRVVSTRDHWPPR